MLLVWVFFPTACSKARTGTPIMSGQNYRCVMGNEDVVQAVYVGLEHTAINARPGNDAKLLIDL